MATAASDADGALPRVRVRYTGVRRMDASDPFIQKLNATSSPASLARQALLRAATPSPPAALAKLFFLEREFSETPYVVRVVNNCVAFLHRGSHVVERSFVFPERVLDAVMTHFDTSSRAAPIQNDSTRSSPYKTPHHKKRVRGQGLEPSSMPHLCVLVRVDCVNIYTPTGEVYEAALPFQASRLFAMDSGLIMQRSPPVHQPSFVLSQSSQSSQKGAETMPNAALFIDKELAARPRFFTLAHPLDEVKPVALLALNSSSSSAQPQETQLFLCDPALEIVAFLASRELLVCFHCQERRFCVYELQKSPVVRTQRVAPVQIVDSATWQKHREKESGGDDDKVAISPDWIAQPQWESPAMEARSASSMNRLMALGAASKTAFLASDVDLAPLLCLMDKQSGALVLKRLDGLSNEQLTTIPRTLGKHTKTKDSKVKVIRCRDALPISSAASWELETSATDIVVFQEDRKLVLHRGEYRICDLVAPSSVLQVSKWPATTEIRALDGALGFEICGHSVADFPEMISRCEHPLQVAIGSPLLEKAFSVLEDALPATVFLGMKADIVAQYQHQHRNATTKETEKASTEALATSRSSVKNEWEVFCDTMTAIVDPVSQSYPSVDNGSGDDAMEVESESAFDKLCRSGFHQTYQAENAMLFLQMSSSSVAPATRKPSTISKTKAANERISTLPLQSHAMEIFAGLHLLYEDMKLSVSSSQFRQQLARLQLGMAACLGLKAYAAYYQQETGKKSPSSSTSSVLTKAPIYPGWDNTWVPEILGWVHAKIQSSGRASPSSEAPFPGLPIGIGSIEMGRSQEPGGLRSPLWRTIAICQIYELLTWPQAPEALETEAATKEQEDIERQQRAELMAFLTQTPYGVRLSLQDLPFGVQFPIIEAISKFRHAPPPFITEDICHFIGREDLAGVISSRVNNNNSQSSEHALSQHASHGMKELEANQEQPLHDVSDGLEEIIQLSQPLFPSDQRMKEVARLIRSNRPMCLKLEKTADTSDQDYLQQQQARLLLLCKRSMSLPVARGMVTLGSFDMSMTQNQAWQLRVPELPLAGRTPPTNAIVSLDVSGYAKELAFWPQFHNGCAAGLRLPARDLSNVVNRYWIKYHRPSVAEHQARAAGRNNNSSNNAQTAPPSAEATKRSLEEAYAAHAGLLLGLGLRGHLKCLSMADVYNYLSLSNEFVTVAILLGMATTAAHCRQRRKLQSEELKRTGSSRDLVGSSSGNSSSSPESGGGDPGLGDVSLEDDGFLLGSASKAPLVGSGLELTLERSVSKMLCLHIPSLLPPPFAEFSVPASTQTAALLGLGILYQATGHRLMTELLLTEIARSPSSAQFVSSNSNSGLSTASFDQLEGYALAAGLALGLVVLGRGQTKSGDPGLADMKLEEKLYKYIVGGAQQFGDANAAGGCLYRGRKWNTFGTSGNFGGAGGNSSNGSANDGSGPGRESKSPQDLAWRGEHVNVGVTACGSALALAFMYMQTENKSIAAQLAVPDTLILLDYVRPDLLLVRTLAKNLVLWDSVTPTAEWIEDTQVPTQLANAYKALQGDPQAADRDLDMAFSSSSSPSSVHSDAQSICEAYANVIAGACFSIGFRFAGTGDDRARETLKKYIVHFRDLRSKAASSSGVMAGRGGNIVANATERVTIERCLAVCAQALALVDAGRGSIETLTLLRSINLRQRVDSELTYGNHMALSTAIGLLFIGGGRATVSRSKDAIAALVIALFPMYPMNTADNKYHLQAFRHLYVLAVDTSRLLETIDVNSGSNCSVPVRLELRQQRNFLQGSDEETVKTTNRWQTLQSPCLLPDLSSIKRILISSSEYYPVEILMASKKKKKPKSEKTQQSAVVTANALRLELLRGRNMILLKRTKRNEHNEGLTNFSSELCALLSHSTPVNRLAYDKDDQLVKAFESYFLSADRQQGQRFQLGDETATTDSFASWWQIQRRELVTHHVREEASSFLPMYLNALHALFRLHHLGFQPSSSSSLAGLRNLKLYIDHCEERTTRSLSSSADRDFCIWLKHETEEALKALWGKCGTSQITTISEVQTQIFQSRTAAGENADTEEEQDAHVVVNALVTYFAAPSSRMAMSPEVWKSTFVQQLLVSADPRQQFKLDEFLLRHQHHQPDDEKKENVTQEEKACWLQLVSFFLFGV